MRHPVALPAVLAAILALIAALATPAGTAAQPRLTVQPPAGDAGDFTAAGEGFAPHDIYVLVTRDTAGNEVRRGRVQAGADGRFAAGYPAHGLAPGAYTVEVYPIHLGTMPLTAATLTLPDRPAPPPAAPVPPAVLPAAGGGGMAANPIPTAGGSVTLLLAALALLARTARRHTR